MTDLNQYTCTGRLGADPDCRTFSSGDPVVNLRVAVSEQWKDANTGEKREKTLWLPVSITNKGLCSVAERFLRKGSRVALSGKLESRSFDKNGVETWVTELVLGPFNATLTMLDGKPEGPAREEMIGSDGVRRGGNNYPADKGSRQIQPPAFEGGASGDDIPFAPEWRV